jgi:hypothetical protein
MIDYSKMSYEQLRTIADNDSLADRMSEEEYEALSVQMWRKFGMEQGIRDRHDPLVPVSGVQTLRSLWHRLTSQPSHTGTPLARDKNASASPHQLKGLFRSGD